jgi:hypothetical protein
VRQSWAEPIAWAELDGEPATPEEAERLWQGRPERLKAQLSAVEEQLEATRAELRSAAVADRMAGRPPLRPSKGHAELQQRVRSLRARLAELAAELDTSEPGRQIRLLDPNPHGHLRHRPLPLAQDLAARSRMLRVWASASGVILFVAMGLLLLSGAPGLLVPAALVVAAMLLVEAALRGHLIGLVLNLVLAAAVVVAAWWVARLLLANIRFGVGVLLLLAAAYMAAQTAADAFLHRRSR